MVDDNKVADEFFRRLRLINEAFSPSAPVTDRDLLAGRTEQLTRLMDVSTQRGQHALIYGERGVGKTSLGRVSSTLMVMEGAMPACYYTCSSADTFDSIWRSIFADVRFTTFQQAAGFNKDQNPVMRSASEFVVPDGALEPNQVRRIIELLKPLGPLVVTIDEFDQVQDHGTRKLMADTVKILSDHAVDATIVFVGVGDTVEELVSSHESVVRSLVQVHMPRMTPNELSQIVIKGMAASEMSVDQAFVSRCATMSLGLPHYTHLIAQHAAKLALEASRDAVSGTDLDSCLKSAANDVSQIVRRRYHDATVSNRDTIYREVLLACALAEKDDLGMFSSPEVRDRLRQITGRQYEIPAFANHLNDFSSQDGSRGRTLEKEGTTRRFRYRFLDPLMPPYVLMKGVEEGMIAASDV